MLLALDKVGRKYAEPVIVSLHPRAKKQMELYGLRSTNKNVCLLEPFGFFDFIALEKNARCVITDSGTVQEECCIFRVPNVTIRDVTERPETIESGSNMIVGVSPDLIMNSIKVVLQESNGWEPPKEYVAENVSSKVLKIVLGYLNG